MINSVLIYSRLIKFGRLFLISIIVALAALAPLSSYAHPSPNSLVFLDVSPNRVALEMQLPVPELALSFGNDIARSPETLIETQGRQLKEYIAAHVHAYATQGNPWLVEITDIYMDKGKYTGTDIPYWEVIVKGTLTPQPGENTRTFFLDYDVIMHQVINHVALVSIRSDWETGNLHGASAEASVIQWNMKDNVIDPLAVNLEKGSWWNGCTQMLLLGMHHIKAGTDHLLFLMVLLLPAMLVVHGKKWGSFGGARYSLMRLLKIVTAFTIGHSITLLIGALGWLKLPTQPVEILIAISILVSAIHAIYPIFPGKEAYVAAGFGLVHGLAFATILANLKLGAGTLALSIVGFNVGIEVMQLFIIAIIVPWLMLLSQTPLYKWFRISGAVIAGVAALAWVVERSTGKPNGITALIAQGSSYGWWSIISLAIIAVIAYAARRFNIKSQNVSCTPK
jgi:hypothetical protein